MANVEAIKWVSHLNGYMVIRYQVFMKNLILSFDLVAIQFGVTISLKISYLICWANWKPMRKALYSAILLQGSINENERGRTWFSGETNTTPTPAMILPIGLVLDALSKNICHTSSPKVILALMTSSAMSSCSFEVSETGWVPEICERLTFDRFLGDKNHIILR